MNHGGPERGFRLDRVAARRFFERASATCDAVGALHDDLRSLLVGRLALTSLEPRLVLDVGAGTGQMSRALKQRYPRARVIAVDFSPAMLRAAGRQRAWLRPFQRVCAEASRLPFADASVDLVVSNLLVHWCDVPALFGEVRRVLAPRGLFSFTSLGPDTLRELRESWASVDATAHVHDFPDMHDLGDELVRAGLAAPVLDVDRYTLQYSGFAALAADLRAAGARNAAAGRRRGLTTRAGLAALEAAYERYRQGGRLPASFEVVYGHAWAPLARDPVAGPDAGISLAALRAKLPGRGRER